MRTLCAIVTVVLGVAVIPGRPARAQVSLQIAVPVPTIRFEVAPPLVVVSPGVQVVPEYEEEVFFVDGWYWHRSGPYWYRTRDYRGGWVVVERRYVPGALVRIPPGQYKHYRARGLPPGQAKKFEREREGKFERERERERFFATPNGPPLGEVREKRGGEGKERGGEGKEHGHGKWKD